MASIFQNVVRSAGGVVKFNVGTGSPASPITNQHLLMDNAGAVYAVNNGGPAAAWVSGVPFDANGRVMISQTQAVDRVGVGGLPLTANGSIAVGGATTHYHQGIAYAATGKLAAT